MYTKPKICTELLTKKRVIFWHQNSLLCMSMSHFLSEKASSIFSSCERKEHWKMKLLMWVWCVWTRFYNCWNEKSWAVFKTNIDFTNATFQNPRKTITIFSFWKPYLLSPRKISLRQPFWLLFRKQIFREWMSVPTKNLPTSTTNYDKKSRPNVLRKSTKCSKFSGRADLPSLTFWSLMKTRGPKVFMIGHLSLVSGHLSTLYTDQTTDSNLWPEHFDDFFWFGGNLDCRNNFYFLLGNIRACTPHASTRALTKKAKNAQFYHTRWKKLITTRPHFCVPKPKIFLFFQPIKNQIHTQRMKNIIPLLPLKSKNTI